MLPTIETQAKSAKTALNSFHFRVKRPEAANQKQSIKPCHTSPQICKRPGMTFHPNTFTRTKMAVGLHKDTKYRGPWREVMETR